MKGNDSSLTEVRREVKFGKYGKNLSKVVPVRLLPASCLSLMIRLLHERGKEGGREALVIEESIAEIIK